jgi:hypothetical protein
MWFFKSFLHLMTLLAMVLVLSLFGAITMAAETFGVTGDQILELMPTFPPSMRKVVSTGERSSCLHVMIIHPEIRPSSVSTLA